MPFSLCLLSEEGEEAILYWSFDEITFDVPETFLRRALKFTGGSSLSVFSGVVEDCSGLDVDFLSLALKSTIDDDDVLCVLSSCVV